MAPPALVSDAPAPPVEDEPAPSVEEAPDSPELDAVSVALLEADSVPLEEDSVADDDPLAVEDASLAVDEASLAAEEPVSWLPPVLSPLPVMPPRTLLTAPPAAEVIPPTMLGYVSKLFVGGRGRG